MTYQLPYNPNALTGTNNRARIGGSTFTVFTWQNQPISFARQISHQSPAPVGTGTVPIHPLDAAYPVELITPMALTMGTIVLELYELFGANVWQRLAVLSGNTNILDSPAIVDLAGIFQAVANSDRPIHITRIIIPPKMRGKLMTPYSEEFHNCVVSTLDDGETIEVGTMEVLKRITVNYTHITKGGENVIINDTKPGQGVGPGDFFGVTPGANF